MGRENAIEITNGANEASDIDSTTRLSKLAWSSTALSLASLMLLTDQADAQQSEPLPTIEVTPPPRARTPQRPRRQARPAPAPAAAAPAAVPTQTEATGPGTGYQAASSGVSRVATPLINTPQSVTVVPQQVMRDQGTTTMQEALRNVPGITFRAGEGGNQGDSPIIRGFDARNDMFRDGVRDPGWYTRDMFSVDAVEVFKGPSSFLFGRGSTGGVINLVTKAPKERNFVETEVIGNTGPGVRATVDANGKVNDNVATRIQLMGQLYDVPDRDHVEENRFGFAPSVAVKLGDQTKATLSYIYQHDDSVPDRGIPFLPASFGTPRLPLPAARGTWYGILSGATADSEVTDTNIVTAKIEHNFTKDIKLTNTTRYVNVGRLNLATLPQGSAPTPANLLTYTWKTPRQFQNFTNELIGNTTDLSANFATGMLQHQFVAGVDLYQEKREQISRTYQNGTAAAASLMNPDPYRAPGTFGLPGVPTTSDATTVAAYVADQIKINEYLELLGGLRFDNFDASSGSTTVLSREDNIWSYRVGAVLHPVKNTSIYVMHGTSANPTAEFLTIAANSANIGPEKNETTEIGAKADVLDGKLSLTAAAFRTEKTNARVPADPTGTVNILAGVTRIDGFELGAQGKITEKWSVFGGYTHLESEIVSTTTAAQLGKEFIGTPNNAFSLWTTYDITDKLTVGGLASYTDTIWADVANTALVPDYWRFDLMAAYKLTDKSILQLNVYNITNELYYASAYTNWVVPAPGRSAALSLRVRW